MTRTGRRGFNPLRDLPALLWLMAVGVAALVHPVLPAPRWLMLHMLLLGALSHSVLVWSRFFTAALLRTRATDDRAQSVRLAMHNAGALTVIAGVLTSSWPVTLLGATSVAAAAAWHGVALWRWWDGALPGRYGGTVRYYIVSSGFLPVGAGLGVWLATGLADPWHTRALLAHVTVNVLGWVGLTVAGTVVTLWPTMLRTRIPEGAETAAARALPVLAGAVLVTAGGALAGAHVVVAVGLLTYVGGLAVIGRSLAGTLRHKQPVSFPAWSVLAGLAWLVAGLLALVVGLLRASTWAEVGRSLSWLTPYLAAGFAAQVLLGALSHLIPVALGGGAGPVRSANAVLDRAAPVRLTATNLALLVCVLPVPSAVRVLASVVVLACLGAVPPLILAAIRAARRERSATPGRVVGLLPAGRPRGQSAGMAVTGLAAVVLVVAVGVAVDPTAVGAGRTESAAAGVTPTGETTTVEVVAEGMRFTPETIEVPAGNRLVIELTNRGDDIHDLVLDSGVSSGRIGSGDSVEVDVGVVGRDVEGWCSVVVRRQMGMVLHIRAVGAPPDSDAGSAPASHHSGADDGPPAVLDPLATPGPDFRARDARLPALPEGRVHRRTFTVREVEREVAPGVTQRLWTYDGTAPGPVLHGRVGDLFVIRLVNDGTIGHSIDFHAGSLAPDRPMRTIGPGESLVYRFRATRAGVWMYHCSTMPMSSHIANGLFGAVVIESPDLPPADRDYVLVQSELYLGEQGGEADADKVRAETPDAVVFNGYANQYDHRPLVARVGERVRVWVLDAGPNRPTSFHVVGGQFRTTYAEGAYLLRGGAGGAQSLALAPAQGGFVELTFPEPGDYPFVSHLMVDAERGAHGIFRVRR